MTSRFLAIYLRDHMAGAQVGRELARRAARGAGTSEVGAFLERLAREIEADRVALAHVMARLEVPQSGTRNAIARMVERVARLKANGSLVRRSPLSTLVELEGLTMGVNGKRALWQSLVAVQASEPRLAGVDLDRLVRRAEAQLAEVEAHRLAVAASVLVARPAPPPREAVPAP